MFVMRDAGDLDDRSRRAHQLLSQILDLDPSTATGAELAELLEARAQLAAITDGAAVGAVSQWDTSVQWAADGCSSAVSWLVLNTGAPSAAAGALRKTGQLAASMPHIAAAAAAGTLPLTHLDLLTRARADEVAELFDRDEAALVAEAHTLTADRLKDRLREWYFAALAELGRNQPDDPPGPDTDADTASIVRSFQGRGLLRMDLTPESLALITEAVDARIETWRRTGQLTEDNRSWAELVADALVDLITDGSVSSRRGQLRPLLIVTATLNALFERAEVTDAERDRWQARILGGGPIGQAALRELMERANIALVVTDDDGEPLYVGRARRLATTAMLLALIARAKGTCEFPGCSANHHRCHAHHIIWGRNGGPTGTWNLALLCGHHHRLVHHGWNLTRGPTGDLEFRRPDGTLVPEPAWRNAA